MTSKLLVDSIEGRTTHGFLTPDRPAFMARGNNNNYVQTTPIPFPSVDFNIGSHYNNSTYKFTAPTTGVYMFGSNVYYRCDATELALIRFIFRFPFITLIIVFKIHWQAMKLWFKKAPFFIHPKKLKHN